MGAIVLKNSGDSQSVKGSITQLGLIEPLMNVPFYCLLGWVPNGMITLDEIEN
jgi:hypothetical protein